MSEKWALARDCTGEGVEWVQQWEWPETTKCHVTDRGCRKRVFYLQFEEKFTEKKASTTRMTRSIWSQNLIQIFGKKGMADCAGSGGLWEQEEQEKVCPALRINKII